MVRSFDPLAAFKPFVFTYFDRVFFTSFACFLLSGPGPLEWKSKISTNNTTYCDSVRYTGDVILILMPKVEIEGPIAI